ncbi:Probable sulfate transporter Rv1739c/MT1781 [Serratia fonticola]|uniref:Probable sulfate transporter Rv1739c/MT1781 n=1 Tax=Serratia fonticola TaxID=47917 RepID=A0A4U9WAN0_SERFO|nr:Probable sulfate transporter Rv1739c/MT1781 [Serratia fonticola]
MVLIYASWSLLDMRSIFRLRKRNRPAFYLALFTFLSVLLVGIIPALGWRCCWACCSFYRRFFRPTEQLLGVNADGMIHSLGKSNGIQPVDGVIMYRFNSPLTYFNVAYFKRRITTLVDGSQDQPRWVVIDAVASFTHADISVLAAVRRIEAGSATTGDRPGTCRPPYRIDTLVSPWIAPAAKENKLILVPDCIWR